MPMKFTTFFLQNVALATGYVLKQSTRNYHHSSNNIHRPILSSLTGISQKNHHGLITTRHNDLLNCNCPRLSTACFFTSNSNQSPLANTKNGRSSTNNRISQQYRLPRGWKQDSDGEWRWEEDDPNFVPPASPTTTAATNTAGGSIAAVATPKLPGGVYAPKKSLGQNYLKDPNTVVKILKAFHQDASHKGTKTIERVIELGPGAGALTDRLVELYGTDIVRAIEIDERSIGILRGKHPELQVRHADILQVDYPQLAKDEGQALVVIGNLPYYITSQILFALVDASHFGAVDTATVTMQWEVGQRMVAATRTKDYGILSVVFQLYADVHSHFKIPPTVFYPVPKVDSALIGVHFLGPSQLRKRLAGVQPGDFRRIVTTSFQQRRKTVRNSLKKLAKEICNGDAEKAKVLLDSLPHPLPAVVQQAKDDGDEFASTQQLPDNWATKRPEELTSGQFVELTRLFFGPADPSETELSAPLGNKVWRKMKHGLNIK